MALELPLSMAEFAVAVQSAMTRMLISAGQGINHASTYKRTWLRRLHEEVVGCLAELAMGKFIDRYFIPEVGTFHTKPDCLHDIEVRATAWEDGSLIIRDNDADDRRYVFCVVSGKSVEIMGWLYGYEAKKNEYIRNPNAYRASWFVPQAKLRAVETLDFSERPMQIALAAVGSEPLRELE